MNKEDRIRNIELLAELEDVQKTLKALSVYVEEKLDEVDDAVENVIQKIMSEGMRI